MNLSLPAHLRRHLESRGIDVAQLPPVPHPRGWQMTDDEFGQWRRDNAETILARAVPPRFRSAEIDDVPADVKDWLRDHLAAPQQYPSLYLMGLTGRGKTHCAWAVLKTIVRYRARHGLGCDWRFVNNAALNIEVRPKPDQSHAYAVNKYLNPYLTVLDDVGSGNASEYVTEALLRIIDYRTDANLPMIYTSNLGPADLIRVLGERIESRIMAATAVIIDGPDRRLQ